MCFQGNPSGVTLIIKRLSLVVQSIETAANCETFFSHEINLLLKKFPISLFGSQPVNMKLLHFIVNDCTNRKITDKCF